MKAKTGKDINPEKITIDKKMKARLTDIKRITTPTTIIKKEDKTMGKNTRIMKTRIMKTKNMRINLMKTGVKEKINAENIKKEKIAILLWNQHLKKSSLKSPSTLKKSD